MKNKQQINEIRAVWAILGVLSLAILNPDFRVAIASNTAVEAGTQVVAIAQANQSQLISSIISRQYYYDGEPIELGFYVTNAGNRTETIKFESKCEIQYEIGSSTGGMFCDKNKKPVSLKPGESTLWEIIHATSSGYVPRGLHHVSVRLLSSNVSLQTDLIFIEVGSSVVASNMSAWAGSGISDYLNGPVTRYPVTYNFTLTNLSGSPIYVSKGPAILVDTIKIPTISSSTINVINPMSPLAGDTAVAYIIPSGGSRVFSLSGIITNTYPSYTAGRLTISAIKYGFSPTTVDSMAIKNGLEALSVGVFF